MRLMVSDLKGLVVFAYPLVSAAGMLQLYNMHNIAKGFSAAVPAVTPVQLLIGSMVYPLFFTGFLKLDGENVGFKLSTVAFVSAIMGLVLFPVLTVLMAAVLPGVPASNPFFNGFILTVDFIAAVAFLFALTETDLHELPNSLIWISFSVLEVATLGYILNDYGVFAQTIAALSKAFK